MEVTQPIFIIGSGRSGSSILHQMMVKDRQLNFFTNTLNKWPKNLRLNQMAVWLYQSPIKIKKIIPDESYLFWDTYYRGFSQPMRDLEDSDVTDKVKNKIRNMLYQMSNQNRKRVLIKITGYSRVGFLKEIFPDAKFIHIIRDGCSVANSFLNVEFWKGWNGPDKWNLGPLTADEDKLFKDYNQSFVALAGIYWNKCIDSFDQAVATDDIDYLEIRYSDLCNNTTEVMREIFEYSNLEWTDDYEKSLNKFSLKNENVKWKDHLTKEQIIMLENICKSNNKKHKLRGNYE